MEGHTATVRCPNCAAGCETTIPVPLAYVGRPWRAPQSPEPEELTCPACGWEFVATSAGDIADGGGADHAGPVTVGPDEPDVTLCPHCSRPLDVDGEPGPVRCPTIRTQSS